MYLTYRDPSFWKNFQARHWKPRVPTVLRQPFRDFPYTEPALLRAMQAFELGIRGGDVRSQCLVSVGDSEKPPRRPLRKLFGLECDSLAQLEKNCAKTFPKQRFGLMVSRFEVVDPGIWDPITAFLQDARQNLNSSFPRAFLDLFYGNYTSTFTGLHKDTQEIFAFVVRGEKRILAWPFDYFLSKVKGLSSAARFFHMRLPIDHRKYRKDAVVLEASAGDVFYWPSDHWHVAEPLAGSSAMISLGLFHQDLAAPKSEAMGDAEAARHLRWQSGFGFELGGPLAKGRRRKAGEVTVIKKEVSLILWKVLSNGRVLVSANGHSLTLPHSRELVALIERLSLGESVRVADGDLRKLVDWLLRVCSVERVEVSRD